MSYRDSVNDKTNRHTQTLTDTDIQTHIHMCAYEHAHLHILTFSEYMHTLSFKLTNIDGYIYTHHVQQEDTIY